MNRFNQIPYNPVNAYLRNIQLLDLAQGDVNGDNIIDYVYLYGNKPDGPAGIFADNITLFIQDGASKNITQVDLKYNAGYNARLFLGDFTMDKVSDIKVDIDSGGSGGYLYSYIYSFRNNYLEELFDFERYNNEYRYRVDYGDFYKVYISNVALDKLLILDISYKGYDYLSRYYDENGKLKRPVTGEVLPLGGLFPIAINERTNSFDLLAVQRVIGTSNADTLGYVTNLLRWNGRAFIIQRMVSVMDSINLVSHFK
ncbi:MAG: VCBS repeat-containing protein [Clostridia bacterium]|nr:VCBS repeat-containing protein [Clostridia bacterium]